MTLREYRIGDRTYQYDDSDVPAGAELVVTAKADPKPANKARIAPKNK